MKKTIAWILLAMMLFAAVGCGKKGSTATKEEIEMTTEGVRQVLIALERIFEGTRTNTNSETGETYEQRTEAIIYPEVHAVTEEGNGIYTVYTTATFEAVEIKNEERVSVWGYGVYRLRMMIEKAVDGSYTLLDFAYADEDSSKYAEEMKIVCGGNVVVQEDFNAVNLEDSWTELEKIADAYLKKTTYTVE